MVTCGGVLLADTSRVVWLGLPRLSFTVSDTVNLTGAVVAVVNVCAGLAAVLVVPSPKFQRYVSGCPSGSDEVLPVNCTARGLGPYFLSDEALATGGRLVPEVYVILRISAGKKLT